MRQGQQPNRQRSRGRGNNNNNSNSNRNNNNRNQMNRSMESNGPDVRIRGTAAHIAEKYVALANDAQTAGDTVAAQSYWQFAEHYNRLVATAQLAQQQAREEQDAKREARGDNRSEQDGDDGDGHARNERGRGRRSNRNSDDESSSQSSDDNAGVSGDGPQPTLEETPAEVMLKDQPVESSDAEDKPKPKPKPRRAKRPRKEEPAAGADDADALPAFVTGAE